MIKKKKATIVKAKKVIKRKSKLTEMQKQTWLGQKEIRAAMKEINKGTKLLGLNTRPLVFKADAFTDGSSRWYEARIKRKDMELISFSIEIAPKGYVCYTHFSNEEESIKGKRIYKTLADAIIACNYKWNQIITPFIYSYSEMSDLD